MSNTTGFFIRDTLVSADTYNAMPDNKKEALNELLKQYRSVNYIDVRTQLGPDQIRRMSERQKSSIANNMLKVFEIESKVKELLKTDEQLQTEAIKEAAKAKQDRINKIGWRIRDIEMYLQRKLASNRENPTKKEYRELKAELATLNN